MEMLSACISELVKDVSPHVCSLASLSPGIQYFVVGCDNLQLESVM